MLFDEMDGNMINEEQKKISDSSIGGSSIAAVLGLSNYKTQLQIWGELTGLIPKEDISDKMQVRLGTKMESVVAEIFTEDTGKRLHRVNETFVHEKHQFLVGHIDRRVVGERAVVEIKTTSAWNRDQWKEGQAPQEYLIQLMWYLGLTNTPMGYLVALIGNQELAIVPVVFDKEIYESMAQKAVRFWEEFVVPKVMPTKIVADDSSTLYQLFPISDPNKDIILPDTATRTIEALEANIAQLKAIEDEVERGKNELKAMLGESESGQAGPYRITWKNQVSKRIESQALKDNYPEVYKSCLKESKTRVLRYAKKEMK